MIDEVLRSNKFYEVYFAFTFPKCLHATILFVSILLMGLMDSCSTAHREAIPALMI